MKFELNDYHRNVSDADLIQDVIRVAQKLGKETLTTDEYRSAGIYSYTTLRRRFGSWKQVMKKTGLSIEQNNFHVYITNEEYISDIQQVARSLKKDTLIFTEYKELGTYDAGNIPKRFGSWAAALVAAGLHPTGYTVSVTNEELLEEIEQLWIRLGRQPTSTDVREGQSRYGLTTYVRHFGSWRNALVTFVNYVNEDNEQEPIEETVSQKELSDNPIAEIRHKTKRDINLRLRFLVMKRDNFKCCKCGASPAKDPSVELHIDHIKPWSKGGETVMDNLETLCSKCNLGKSDLE